MKKRILSTLALLALGCSKPAPAAPAEAPAELASASTSSAEPAAASPDERHFGAPSKLTTPPVPVDEVLASPDPLLGKTIKCEGTVARVCQAAGCWLELQAKEGEGLRVPMANHAFFIPQDAVGKLAIVEGELRRHELPPGQREHYASEGMKAMGPLSLEATSVVLR